MLLIYIHIYNCLPDNRCESSSVCLLSKSYIPEETAMLQEMMASMCVKLLRLVLILHASAMCLCVTVNQPAICTVALTWVNCEASGRRCAAL